MSDDESRERAAISRDHAVRLLLGSLETRMKETFAEFRAQVRRCQEDGAA